ncbi:MAG: hypothetical protein HY901_02880 [Deltaproteobacteria bacterium]|nr:hypothetical protein [Deltaproteobacteria bacterium]
MAPKPPPKKPGAKPNPADALKRRLTSDGFQLDARPLMSLGIQTEALDRSKAIAGILKRLTDRAAVPPTLAGELDRVAKSAISGDEWQLLQRTVLSSPAPTGLEEVRQESRRFATELDGPLSRLVQSWHLRRLREAGVPLSPLLRGAEIVLVFGRYLYDPFVQTGAKPFESPRARFPDTHAVILKDFGTLFFAPAGAKDLWLRMGAPVSQLRKLAPQLITFWEQHFAQGQRVGPMGCSPKAEPLRVEAE